VRSLVLACTSARADRPSTLARADAAARGGMEGVLDSTLDRWFTAAALAQPRHPGVAYARERLLRDDPQAFAQTWRAMADHDVVESLRHMTAPLTVIAGAHDTASPVEHRRAMHARLPNSRFEILDGPHMLQLEVPRAFSDAVRRHVQWASGRGG
jgi:3-oxoadipate enol-lactonase